MRVFDTGTNDLGESTQKIGKRSRELVTTDELPVIAKPFLDAMVMEGDICFPDATWADESDRTDTLSQIDNLLHQLSAPETCPGLWGRQFSRRVLWKYKTVNPLPSPQALTWLGSGGFPVLPCAEPDAGIQWHQSFITYREAISKECGHFPLRQRGCGVIRERRLPFIFPRSLPHPWTSSWR